MPRRQFIFLFFLLFAASFNLHPSPARAQHNSGIECQNTPIDPDMTAEVKCSMVVSYSQMDGETVISIAFSAIHHEACPPSLGDTTINLQDRKIQIELVDEFPDLDCPQALTYYSMTLGPFELSEGTWEIDMKPTEDVGGNWFFGSFSFLPELTTDLTLIYLPIIKN